MRIQSKLILALLLLAVLISGSMLFLLKWSFERGMVQYLNEREIAGQEHLLETLSKYHQKYDNWDALIERRRDWERLLFGSMLKLNLEEIESDEFFRKRHAQFKRQPKRAARGDIEAHPHERLGARFNRYKLQRIHLYSADKSILIGRNSKKDILLPIKSQGLTVGWIGFPQQKHIQHAADLSFRKNQFKTFAIISVFLLVLCLMVAIPLARQFIRPVKELAKATAKLKAGNYETNLNVKGSDELAQLAADFNSMSETLYRTERTRKLWLSSVSHELRTPLAIIQAEIQAILDGIRELNFDNLKSVNQEVERLKKLIEDLNDLNSAELGTLNVCFEQITMSEYLAGSIERHKKALHKNNLIFCQNIELDNTVVSIDPHRFDQVIDNLFSNAFKYLPDNSTIELTAIQSDKQVHLTFEDSGPGVSDAELPRLFDYLYRVENSRNRELGGSGLGLSICKKIIEAHEGTIHAEHSPLGGLAITISIPCVEIAKAKTEQ